MSSSSAFLTAHAGHPLEELNRHEEANSGANAGSPLLPGAPKHTLSQPRFAKKGRKCTGLSTWWKEIIAALLVIAAAVASFVTLYPYQGQPLPDWPYSITIGALLSTYSVVLRLAAAYLIGEGLAQLKWRWFDAGSRPLHDFVLHDDATRGPFGAATLLCKMPVPRTWQWLGCILLLVSLLVGPFTQQVLQYVPCSVPVDSQMRQASIPRSSLFIGQGIHQGAATNTLTAAEQVSINAGIYTPGQVGFDCKSGNCTIPRYTSVGYCAQCQDISAQAQFLVVNSTDAGDIYPWVLNVTTSVPDGSSMSWVYEDGNTNRPMTFAAADTANYGGSSLQITIGLPNKPLDASTGQAPTGCDDVPANPSWRCQGYGIANCRLTPCTRSYSADITNGILQENILNESTEFGFSVLNGTGAFVESTMDAQCLKPEEVEFLRKAGYTIDHSTKWIPYSNRDDDGGPGTYLNNQPDSVMDAFENSTLDRGCLYGVDYLFDNGLNLYFASAFPGNLSGIRGTYTKAINTFTGSQLLQTIYNFGNFSFERTLDVFNNMSLSLTNHMRTNPGRTFFDTKSPALGQAFTTKTCVHVEWAWLAMPAILALSTLAFFIGVVLSSGKLTSDVRTWKHSSLPLVFHGPRPNETIQHVEDMNDAAREMRVRLVKDGKGDVTLCESRT